MKVTTHVLFGCPFALCSCDVQYNACLATCVLATFFKCEKPSVDSSQF